MNMRKVRIIPRLDIKGPNLVKGIHLEGLRVLGKPENFSRYYYESGADDSGLSVAGTRPFLADRPHAVRMPFAGFRHLATVPAMYGEDRHRFDLQEVWHESVGRCSDQS